MRLRAWSEEFTIYSSAPWLWGKGKVTACSWARAASSLRNSQKMTAQYTAFFTRSASACFSRPEAPPPPLPLNRALCSDWPPSRTCARASWAACRARVGLLVWRRIRSPRDGLRLFTKTRKHYIYKSSHHHFFPPGLSKTADSAIKKKKAKKWTLTSDWWFTTLSIHVTFGNRLQCCKTIKFKIQI